MIIESYYITNGNDGIGSGRKSIKVPESINDDFQHTVERVNAIGKIDWLHEVGKITEEERNTLCNMINSQDLENFYLAVELINVKSGFYKKEYKNGTEI